MRGEELVFWVFRSEPFSGVIYDSKAPKAFIYLPDGSQRPLALKQSKLFDYARGVKRFAWEARFLVEKEGDFFLVFETEPRPVPGLNEVWREWVKVPLHVGPGRGWEKVLGLEAEIVPLTQPYGLEAGMTFRARLLFQGEPLPEALVQVVPYHGRYLSAEDLPRDPRGRLENARMYFATLTDEGGLFSVSLPRPGWWLISARIPAGNFKLGEITYPLYLRASFWLYVFPPFKVPEKAPALIPRKD